MKAVVLRKGFFNEESYKLEISGDEFTLTIGKYTTDLKGDEWNETKEKALFGRRLIIALVNEQLKPVVIKKEAPDKDSATWEFLNADHRRNIKKSVMDTRNLARTRWMKIRDLSLTVLVVLIGLAAVIVVVAIITKYGVDQAGALRGAIKDNILNNTLSTLGG